MDKKKILKSVGENINPFKTGRKKTLAMIKGHSMTLVTFLVMVLFVLFSNKDASTKFFYLAFLIIAEGIFGAYSFLSLRLRKVEEKLEKLS